MLIKYIKGQKVFFEIVGEKPVKTKIIGFGTKNGRKVYDLANGRWGYGSNIKAMQLVNKTMR